MLNMPISLAISRAELTIRITKSLVYTRHIGVYNFMEEVLAS